MKHFQRLLRFMIERHSVYLRRLRGESQPWTPDPILQRYRFTNVYRELDRVTVWIDKHIRQRFAGDSSLWFMLCIARQINWPETLTELIEDPRGAWPHADRWSWRRCARILLARKARGEQVYTGAYMLTCQPPSLVRDGEKANFTAEVVLDSVWKARRAVEPELHGTLQRAHAALLPYHGWGGFMAYEVVSDLRYTRYLRNATDVYSWAHAGPGALRGLNRVFGRPLKARLPQGVALEDMVKILTALREELHWPRGEGWPPLELREVEHSLCEFDKYERARLEQGRPRQLFNGGIKA